jgi:hypothetical protein
MQMAEGEYQMSSTNHSSGDGRLTVDDRGSKVPLCDRSKSDESYRVSYGTIDSKALNKRVMLKAPFGNMWYAHNASQDDSFMARKSAGLSNKSRNSVLYNERRLINYLEGNIDFPPDIASDPVKMYIKQRRFFSLALVFMLVIDIVCSIVGFINRQDEIRTLSQIDRVQSSTRFLGIFLEVIFSIDIMVYGVQSLFGVLAYFTNKSSLFNIHSMMTVGSIVTVIFLSYIHQIFLGAFLFRIVYYVYVRYVISLLHTILLLPPEMV